MSVVGAVAALGLAWGMGTVLVTGIWRAGPDPRPRGLILAFGAALGPALLSCVDFLGRWLGATAPVLLGADAVLAAAALGWAWRLRSSKARAGRPPTPLPPWPALVACGLLGLACIASLLVLAATARTVPHGLWDAWAIWNLKAKIVGFGPAGWAETLAIGTPHADYPLLHPIVVARLWWYSGGSNTLAPVIWAGYGVLTTVALIVGTVSHLRGIGLGAVAGLTLVGSAFVTDLATWQYADPTVALYMCASLALLLLALRSEHDPIPLFALMGAAVGAAAWTKNEGLVWAAVLCIATFLGIGRRDGWRRAGRAGLALLIGAAPFVLCVFLLKLGVSARTDLLADRNLQELLALAVDGDRHRLLLRVGSAVLSSYLGWWRVAPLLALLIVAGDWRDAGTRSAALQTGAVLLATLAIFYLVYLLTPHDLRWHVETSANRVPLQLWPAFLVWAFACLGPATNAHRAG